jgi:hypothetical protein
VLNNCVKILLFFYLPVLFAQQPASMRCLYVQENGFCRIQCNAYNGSGFIRYELHRSTQKTGPYSIIYTQTLSTALSYTDSGCDAQIRPYFYVLKTVYGSSLNPGIGNSDTLQTLFVSAAYAIAQPALKISYNPLSPKILPSAFSTYTIERAFPLGTYTVLAKTPLNHYFDTLSLCRDSIGYRVWLKDSLGCFSLSNRIKLLAYDTKDPEQPDIDSITVLPNGHTLLTWKLPVDQDVKAYQIQYRNSAGINIPLQTLTGRYNLRFEWMNQKADSQSVALFVGAIDSCGRNSTINYTTKTIFLQGQWQACNSELQLKWTPYTPVNAADQILYCVYAKKPDQAWVCIKQTTLQQTSISDFDATVSMQFFVRAFSRLTPKSSSSNTYVYQATNFPQVPLAFVAIDDQDDGYFNISYTHALHPRIQFVELAYSRDNQKWQRLELRTPALGTLQSLNRVKIEHHEPIWFKLRLLDSCLQNLSTPCILKSNWLNTRIENPFPLTASLQWNRLSDDTLSAVTSILFRLNPNTQVWDTLKSEATQQAVDYPDSLSTVTGQISYRVLSTIINPNSSTAVFSNRSYIQPESYFFIPNAFNPNGFNRIWRPVPYFIPLNHYQLQVFDRSGNLVFESKNLNEGWDGGNWASGQYTFRITFKNAKNKAFTQFGTLTLLR